MKRRYAFMVDLGGIFGGKAYALSTNKRAAKRQFAYGGVHTTLGEIQRITVKRLRRASRSDRG
jgi:hypothetical protein